jgi:hypothetical protein
VMTQRLVKAMSDEKPVRVNFSVVFIMNGKRRGNDPRSILPQHRHRPGLQQVNHHLRFSSERSPAGLRILLRLRQRRCVRHGGPIWMSGPGSVLGAMVTCVRGLRGDWSDLAGGSGRGSCGLISSGPGRGGSG